MSGGARPCEHRSCEAHAGALGPPPFKEKGWKKFCHPLLWGGGTCPPPLPPSSYATDVSLLAPVKKQNNTMFLSGNKMQTAKIRDQLVDLKETKDLCGRLMVLAKWSLDVDLKNATGNYEFTVTPTALFVPDGSILPCANKSKLIHCLAKLEKPSETDPNEQVPSSEVLAGNVDESETSPAPPESPKIAIVIGMMIVQQMAKKWGTISTVRFQPALQRQATNVDSRFWWGYSLILVFDTYKADSLKQKNNGKNDGKAKIPFNTGLQTTQISAHTNGHFLSHEKTKANLTEYLAEAVLKKSANSQKLIITHQQQAIKEATETCTLRTAITRRLIHYWSA